MKVLADLKRFLLECIRVLKITRKPTGEEFQMIVKVSGLGITLIGLLGFLLQVAKQLIPL
ncbi:MAG TPA: protein translocase SEC61 complex subunit gamma [Candidatus Nanoarchaeia archaeon]|nr:protein translocase SEC61 complex subunit gamma [Candidatus Nanoarchaeia archaeon]